MLRKCKFNIFFQKKAVSSSCMWISGYDIIHNSSASNHQQLVQENRFVTRQKLENEKDFLEKKNSYYNTLTLNQE